MNMRLTVFTSCLIAVFGSYVQASPSPSRHERELLIGGNSEKFVTIQQIKGSPASHYQSYRTMSLNTYESSTGKLLTLHHIDYVSSQRDIDETAWKHRPKKVEPVELTKVIRNLRDFEYAWTHSLDEHTSGRLFATPDGIVAENDNGDISIVLPVEKVEALAPWYLSTWRHRVYYNRQDNRPTFRELVPGLETSGSESRKASPQSPPPQVDASKFKPPCDSCRFWSDPEYKRKLPANSKSADDPAPVKRTRETCLHGNHPQLESAYICAGRLYVVLSETQQPFADENSQSVILRLPLPGDEQ